MHCPKCLKEAESYEPMIFRGSHYHCLRCGFIMNLEEALRR